MRLRSLLVLSIAVLAVLLLGGRALTALVVDHAWYTAMGVPGVFWERVTDTLALQGVAWLAGSLFAFANLHAVRLTILAVAVPSRVANIEMTAMLPPRRLLSITIVMAAVVGLALALPLSDWTTVAMARHGVPFNEIEGILDRDLGFYVYALPLEETAYLWALAAVVSIVLIVLLLYTLTRSLRLDGRRVLASTHVRRHLSVLGALVLLLLAWSYRLDGFDLLQRGSGPDGLFLRIDHVVTLQVDRVLVVVCGIAAAIVLRAGWIGQMRLAFITLSIVLLASIGGRQVLPSALARSAVVGDLARRDLPYVATRTLVSRRAYDVDRILNASPERSGPVRPTANTRLALSELAAQVSLWDPDGARRRTTDRGSNTLDAGAVGWTRTATGRLAALLVRRPTTGTDEWSIAVADVTQPSLRDSVLDIAISSRGEERPSDREPISAPGLHGHRLVADPAGVFGTPVRSLGMRIAQAWARRDPSLLDADTIAGPAPRLVAYRDVRERVSRLVPVLVQGSDVQPILYDGDLLWALSLYSSSDRFPLSQRWTLLGEERSYFRFAATVLVDAATGRVRIVPIDRPDPIARSWLERIPSLVTKASDLPAGLLDLLPPASDGAIAQTRAFARYGSRLEGPVARHLPDSTLSDNAPSVHVVSGVQNAVTAWSVPLLDSGDKLGGVITAVGGRVRATYWDSTTVPRARWSEQTDRLRAALDTARAEVPEGSRREPRVRMGRVHVLAGETGPILVQTLVWNRVEGAPFIARVGVLVGDQVVLGGTLAEAVSRLRGEPALPRGPTVWPPMDSDARDARIARLYDVMRDAMRRGDWTRFGAAFDSLGTVLGRTPP
ncbi:MAG: UPF0182 family protein [Gemmatimonadaceae bacterium]|nr:UPF0182 family protein [Gemmatimonadaceae bacterium]